MRARFETWAQKRGYLFIDEQGGKEWDEDSNILYEAYRAGASSSTIADKLLADAQRRNMEPAACGHAKKYETISIPGGVGCLLCDLERLRVASSTEHREPDGYAHRYHDGIRYGTNGRAINGSDPIEAIPFWFHRPPVYPGAAPKPSEQTCPTCGTDLRCIHGLLFSERCEPCEEPEPEENASAEVPQEDIEGIVQGLNEMHEGKTTPLTEIRAKLRSAEVPGAESRHCPACYSAVPKIRFEIKIHGTLAPEHWMHCFHSWHESAERVGESQKEE